MKFENLPTSEGNMQRAKVPGGWILREILECAHIGNDKNEYVTTGYDWRVALCFVPDPGHTWQGGEL